MIFALLSVGGVLTFVFCIALLHILQPQLHSIERAMSEYALGMNAPWLFVVAVFGMGLGGIGLALAIVQQTFMRPWLGIVALVIFGMAMVMTGFFKTDPASTVKSFTITASGVVHTSAGLVAYVSLIVAELALNGTLAAQRPQASGWLELLTVLSVIGFAVLIATLFPVTAHIVRRRSLVGLGERIMGVPFVAWLLAAALCFL